MNTLEMTIENRKRIIAIEIKKYNQTKVLIRLGILEQTLRRLTNKIMALERQLSSIESDITTLQTISGVSLL